MSQFPRRTQSSFVPKIPSFPSQPASFKSNSTEIPAFKTKKEGVQIKFQSLNVTDDLTDEFNNESNGSNNTSSEVKKTKKDSPHFDEICEIDQIAILPFYPVKFNRS